MTLFIVGDEWWKRTSFFVSPISSCSITHMRLWYGIHWAVVIIIANWTSGVESDYIAMGNSIY